jgi:hypothetical protein
MQQMNNTLCDTNDLFASLFFSHRRSHSNLLPLLQRLTALDSDTPSSSGCADDLERISDFLRRRFLHAIHVTGADSLTHSNLTKMRSLFEEMITSHACPYVFKLPNFVTAIIVKSADDPPLERWLRVSTSDGARREALATFLGRVIEIERGLSEKRAALQATIDNITIFKTHPPPQALRNFPPFTEFVSIYRKLDSGLTSCLQQVSHLPSALTMESDALASAVSARQTCAGELRCSYLSIKPLSRLFITEFGRTVQLRVLARACRSTTVYNAATGADRIRKFVDLEAELSRTLETATNQELSGTLSAIRSATRQFHGELSEELQNLRQQLAERVSDEPRASVALAPPDLALLRARATEHGQVMRCLFESITTDFEMVHQRLAELPEGAAALLRLWKFIETRSGWVEAFVRRAESDWCDRTISEIASKIAQKRAELAEIERARCRHDKEWTVGVCGHCFCDKCAKESVAAGKCPYCGAAFGVADLIAIRWA